MGANHVLVFPLIYQIVWVKEIKYYYWSQSHHWCVHLFFFCWVFVVLVRVLLPQLSMSQGCPRVPTVCPHVGPAGRANAGGPYHTGGQRGTDCPPPRPATGDRGPAKVSGGAHFLFARSYLTLVNCFSSGSASLEEICPRTRGSGDKHTHAFFFFFFIFSFFIIISFCGISVNTYIAVDLLLLCLQLNLSNEICHMFLLLWSS